MIILLKAATIHYWKYFSKFFKCFFILGLSIFCFYIVFQFTIVLPIKNTSVESYTIFIEEMEFYIQTIQADDIFNTGFLSDILLDVYQIFVKTNPKFNIGTFFVVLSSLIIIAAYAYVQIDCKKAIREDLTNRDTIKYILQIIFKTIINIGFAILIFIITINWLWSIFFLPFILSFFNAIKTLLFTWIIYFRKYSIFQILSLKNIIRLGVVNTFIMYLHSILFFSLASHLTFYMLLLLALSFFAYTTCVMEFTATKYFIQKRNSRELYT